MNLGHFTMLAPFFLIAVLQIKHVVCDGPLQTLAMVKDKSHYLRPLGLAHAGIHGVATVLILLIFGFAPATAIIFSLIEFFAHYHIDYAKENAVKLFHWKINDGPFWWVMTLDQALHHFTYVVMAFLLFRL
jgi:hypothetical protein